MITWLKVFWLKAQMYVGLFVAAVIAILFATVKHKSTQLSKAKTEIKVQTEKAENVGKVVAQIKDTQVAIHEADTDAITIGKHNEDDHKSGIVPTGNFGDVRLRNR